MKKIALLVFAAAVAIVATASASDRVGVYARVEKVVLEPTPDAPETVQVWGVFSVARTDNPNDYLPPAKGYLYFKLPANKDVARKEWADLRAVAGTDQIVAFGSRWELKARVRKADERPANADIYTTNVGLTRVRNNNQYAPIRGLLEFKD